VSAIPNRRIEGKYEILQKIREGGMGAVYKVRHRLLDEVRVIKLMRPHLGDDPEFKARFIREARVAIKLRHPNVAHLYDFTIGDDDTAFIVMEFIDGRTLEELLKLAGPPPLGLALEIAQQSLRALAYLHAKGFVHRDISPDNLMLAEDADGNPQVKLIDLGIAKVLGGGPESHLTKTGTFLGKLRYASPEQFGAAGGPSADARGDLYSFGVVLYELLTGVHPILGSDPSSIIAGHLFRPPLPFEETDRDGRLPPGLRAVVLRALAKSPDERHAGARELAQELASFRRPGDLQQSDWKSALAKPDTAVAVLPTVRPSSTQHRLDEHFGPTTTPAPSSLLSVARAATAGDQAALAEAAEADQAALAEAAEADQAARAKAAEAERALAAQLAALLDDARALAAREKLKEAGRLLRRAERLAPEDPGVGRLRQELGDASRRRTADRRRTTQIERQAAEIAKRLERGDLEGGAELLAAAAAELGEAEAWISLRDRLESLRGEMRRAQVGALVMRARQLWGNGDLQQAVAAVREAREVEPGNPGVEALAGELEAAAAQQEKERRRAEKLAETVAAVGAKLEGNELHEASKLLDWAVARFGPTPSLREQWERLEELKRRALAQQVGDILERARWLAAAGDLAAARAQLEQARALGDKTPGLLALVEEAGATLVRQADRKRAEELLRDARLLIKVDDYEDAARKLARVLELVPDHAAAKSLLAQARGPRRPPPLAETGGGRPSGTGPRTGEPKSGGKPGQEPEPDKKR
jgi:serine/threonine protein kinase